MVHIHEIAHVKGTVVHGIKCFLHTVLTNADIILDMYHLSRNTLRSAADVTDIFIFTCIVCIGCRGIFFIILVFRHRINSFFTYNIAAAVSDGKIIIRYSACKDKFSPVFSFFFKI